MKKTILITGSTDGIGQLVATRFAAEGHQVIIHGRNQNKLNKVAEEIKRQTGNDAIHEFQLDLSDLGSIKSAANQLVAKVPKIDILINNAGVFKSGSNETKDGIDIRFAVNYLAPILLTRNLLPLLKNSESPRVINLSSAAQSPVNHMALLGKQGLSASDAYAQSKLALTMWSFDLAARESHMTIIPVNPGSLLNTKMVQEAYGQFWSSAEKGSDILYQLAINKEHSSDSGKYFDNDKEMYSKAHPDAYDETKVAQLMSTTNDLLAKYE
ncbi:MAG: SDR family NAD(P)-dependent oxidoreductase [bacterium]|nr:SDR family NAD(P)-dependent oxidoreductase [bacterium]